VQDLVYRHVHPFLAERRFNSWCAAPPAHKALSYEVALPGHGPPWGKALYEEMPRYLDVAEEALQAARAPSEFRERMIDRFPDYGGLKVLDHQLRFLFPEAARHRPQLLAGAAPNKLAGDNLNLHHGGAKCEAVLQILLVIASKESVAERAGREASRPVCC